MARAQAEARVFPEEFHGLGGPVFGDDLIEELDNDLTRQHDGQPQGERIVVRRPGARRGRPPVPGALIEVWQANAGGRYHHTGDQHPTPLDPNFTGGGRALTDSARTVPVRHGQARRVSVAKP